MRSTSKRSSAVSTMSAARTFSCRPNVQMSVPSNLKMTVSPAFWRAAGATSVAVLSVSDGELRRLEVLRDVDRGGLPVRAAAQQLGRPRFFEIKPLMGRNERQVWRLLKAFRRDGAAGKRSRVS
jgi:hypothetical protein